MSSSVIVRFAPSPTGLLHIGNIRAALYNFLFATRHGGEFFLRLEDTDQKRSREEFAEAIERDLTWLGLTWTHKARQSDRLDVYATALERLKATGRVYPCFETQAELDLRRKAQLAQGRPPVYDRAARRLSPEERAKLEAEGRTPHWRFRLEETDVSWNDLIQGPKHFAPGTLSDPVIVREDGLPLFTFSSVLDDVDYRTTHVIRGEDHVTNTVIQLQIWRTLTDAPPPQFAHFPLLVDAEGGGLSKRLGALSIASLRDDEGLEPMAINALLARLGTSDPIEPLATLAALAERFDLAHVTRSTPRFAMKDLVALNAHLVRLMPFEVAGPRLQALGLADVTEDLWKAVAPNLERLRDVAPWQHVVRGPLVPPPPAAEDVAFLAEALRVLPPEPWDSTTWGTWIDVLKQTSGRKGKALFAPLRLALTGDPTGPEMRALLPLIGRARAEKRLNGETA